MAAVSHAQARDIIAQAWRRVHGRAPTAREALYAQAIAWLETNYGRGGQFAALANQGLYNWGALQRRPDASGQCPAGTAPGNDQGSVCFYVYSSDVEAAAAFIRNLSARHWPFIQAARGSAEDVARALRTPPAYYAGYSGSEQDRINAYASAIQGSVNAIVRAVPEALQSAGAAGGASLATLALLGGGLGAAYWYWGRKGRRKSR